MAEGNGLWGCKPDVSSAAYFKGVRPSDSVTVQVFKRNLDLGIADANLPSSLDGIPTWAAQTAVEEILAYGVRGLSLGTAVHYQVVVKKGRQVVDNFGFFSDDGGTWRCDTSIKNQIAYDDQNPVYEATTSFNDVYETKKEIVPVPRNYSILDWEQCQTGAEAFVSRLNQKASTHVVQDFQPPTLVTAVRSAGRAVDSISDWVYQSAHNDASSTGSTPARGASSSDVTLPATTSMPNAGFSTEDVTATGISSVGETAMASSVPAQTIETIDYRGLKQWGTDLLNNTYSQVSAMADEEGVGAEYRSRASPILNQGLNYIQSIPDQVQVPVGQ